MKKIFLLVQEKYQDGALKLLRKMGVVHLERRAVSSEALVKLTAEKAKADTALRMLRLYQIEPEKGAVAAPRPDKRALKEGLVSQTLSLVEERKVLLDELLKLRREKSRIEEWGDFDPKGFAEIFSGAKLSFFLYKLPAKAMEKLPESISYIAISSDKSFHRIAVLNEEIPGRSPLSMSDYSVGEINSLIQGIDGKIAALEDQLRSLAEDIPLLENEINICLENIEFETARAKMNSLDDVPPEAAISWITGFVPQEDLGLIKRGASENGWALLASDPGPEDTPPTKLKNSKFVNLLNPITDFLNISPGYDEPDISPWFLIFLTIFFGMLFGDAAYGALFVIISIIGIIKTAKKGVPIGLKLLLLLGTSNLIWGILTCSWFGLEAHQVPLALQQISLPLISSVTAARSEYDAGIVQQNLMIICFSLALVHLSIGHIIAISRTRGLKILSELGSIAMLLGMYGVVLSLIASNEHRQIPLPMICVYLLAGGFVFVFVFTGYQGSIGASILDGFKNIIGMILGIANVFSDTMSYIRLWAVGLAGGSIAMTVTGMAGPMLGSFIFFIFGVIILALGHGLNLILNLLGVLVHGVRLNTLEFSGHVGLTWSGTAYKPFQEKN
ncbi:MAG: V-type ATP synthase subunit I [Treponema sp.]|nr:V-type ATP synthase subunit I [Treponema sp.]